MAALTLCFEDCRDLARQRRRDDRRIDDRARRAIAGLTTSPSAIDFGILSARPNCR
jgi:hypothetical protein